MVIMGKQRKGPGKKPQEAVEPADDDVGAGENEMGDVVDFDHFLETIDDDSDSEDEDDEGDPAEEDAAVEETDEDDDDEEDDDGQEDMEPEEDEDLNEDESEEEEGDSDERDNSDDQLVEEEGEEGIPIQNGIGGEGSEEEAGSEDEEPGSKKEMTAKAHKMDLQKLAETDPEFFEFLKENDAELLDFNDSDDGSGSDSEEDALHKPPEELEEASDSEAEEERMDDTSKEHKLKVEKCLKKGVVDINVIAHWETQLSEKRDVTLLSDVIEALRCAVEALSQGDTGTVMKWRVDGSANFNALIRLCIKQTKGFCVRYLCGNNHVALSENKFDQKPFEVKDKSKQKWTKLRPKIKSYMEVLVKLLKCLGNPEAIGSVLKHCLRMSGFWALLGVKSYKLMRALVNIWTQGDDSCRVVSFFTIIRMTNYSKDVFLLHMFKQMYISYVANCKFTSVNTWPAINVMRSSLVELYLLDTSLAYSVAFPFIRQLAIHLRNALSPSAAQTEGKHKKSEASRVVYSWQFIHSLHLWVDVLAQSGTNEDGNLKLLIYPIVQICMGTLKLIPTRKFIPIRFHIVRMLIKLQEKTGVFIPVLPLITEVLRMTDFSNKKTASKFSVRPLDLSCCLKADASESGYFKAVSENVFETTLLYCKVIATDLGFPEIVTPTVMYLKTFLKKECKNVEVYKKLKPLLDKIDLNSKYISERRNKALEDGSVTLADKKSHKILQVQMQTSKPHPPLLVYAAEYFKTNQKAQIKSLKPRMETNEERLIPKPSSLKKQSKASQDDSEDDFDKTMFESDAEESDEEFTTKLDGEGSKVGNKGKKRPNKRKMQEDDEDAEQEEVPKVEKKKKKKDKKKVKTKGKKNLVEDIQDELVDYELSD